MRIPFAKYEGAGNDFILIDNRQVLFEPSAAIIAHLCDRHFGIGADGLMTLSASSASDCRMHYYNADGSQGEMCGNGARCFALFAHHLGLGGAVKRFEATDGMHEATLLEADAHRGEVELGMIDVTMIRDGQGWYYLNTGVPHYVEFVDDLPTVDVNGRGRTIRHDTARFAQGVNVNFVQMLGEGHLAMRTYERGVESETLACGTGATAAAIIANHSMQPATTQFRIDTPGGQLRVAFTRQDSGHYTDIRLTGPARRVFCGEYDLSNR